MGARDELVQVLFERARGAVRPNCTEICSGLAVEQAEITQFGLAQGAQTVTLDLPEEHIEPVPVILAEINPEVRDHGCS